MRRVRITPLAIVVVGSLAVFAIFAAFESRLAGIATNTESLVATIAYDESFLRTSGPPPALMASIDARLEDLRLPARDASPGIAVFEEVARAAKVHGVRLSGLRGDQGFTPRAAPKAAAFDEYPFQVVFEGRYANTIRAVSDLARAHLVLRGEGITIERIRRTGEQSEGVRATLALRLIRFAKGRQPNHVRSHAP